MGWLEGFGHAVVLVGARGTLVPFGKPLSSSKQLCYRIIDGMIEDYCFSRSFFPPHALEANKISVQV